MYILASLFAVWKLRHSELISMLFEMPSGFAIFTMLEDLKQPEAMQVDALFYFFSSY
jgi:hypothetical protein